MTTYDDAIGKAREIGREHGENAALAWWADYTPAAGKVIVSRMMAQTSVLQTFGGHLPRPDLSGEWADSLTPRSLAVFVGMPDLGPDDDTEMAEALNAVCDAYEEAFSQAVETAIRAACEQILEPRVPVAVCQTCGETVYPDDSYASGYRHATPGQIHGANVPQ